MRLVMKILTICLAVLLFLVGFGANATDMQNDAQDLVRKAVTYADQYGSEAAFAQFKKPDGGFFKGDLYIFVLDHNGLYITGGKSTYILYSEMIQSDGYSIGEMIADSATEQGVWVEYMWKQPSTGELKHKKSWVIRTKNYIFGSGVYRD